MDDLIGRTIKDVQISADHMLLQFVCTDTILSYVTEGDCCSYSWIQHVENVESLRGARITGVENVDVGEAFEEGAAYIQRYGKKIILEGRAPFLFEFRNSSNGYYGGSIQKMDYDPSEPVDPLLEDF